MPEVVIDRAAVARESLHAVAEAAGDLWPQRRDASIEVGGVEVGEDVSRGVRLLNDIHDIFDRAGVDRLASADLVAHLVALDESPWGDLRGRPLDARELARRLRVYGVLPDTPPTGYDRGDFTDAWVRNSRYSATPAAHATENPREDNEAAEVAEVSERGKTPQHLHDHGQSTLNMFDARCPKCGLRGRLRPAPGGFRCNACQTLSASEVVT